MKGKKIDEAKREEVKTVLYLNPDISQRDLAKTVGLPKTTVLQLKKNIELECSDDFDRVRAAKKEEFIETAWKLVGMTLKKIEEKLNLLEGEALQKVNVRDLAVTMGTIYDKKALACGEPTQINESRKPLPELIEEYKQETAKLDQMVSG